MPHPRQANQRRRVRSRNSRRRTGGEPATGLGSTCHDDRPCFRARIQRGEATGERVLQPIAFERIVPEPRADVSRPLRVTVFRRDRFTCRYCGTRVIPEPILRLLAHVHPRAIPHNINWKAGLTHRAIPILSAEVDHLVPIARGGAPLDLENLRTACPPCNTRKWDLTLAEVGMKDMPTSTSPWDGLTSLYRPLWEAAGCPDERYHRAWMRTYEAVGDEAVSADQRQRGVSEASPQD
jgi:5-methylcytosine-specific restriction endonuclease McrA